MPVHLHATQHLGSAPGGGSGAQIYAVTENGNRYIVKLKGNPQGIRVLFNDYVSGRLGERLGVPFGEHILVTVEEALYPGPTGGQKHPGIQFGTRMYDYGQNDLVQLRQANNFSDFPSVVVFDTFIARGNGRQHLVYPSSGDPNGQRDTGAIYDQGHAFTGNPNWSVDSLQAGQDCVANNGLGLKQHFTNLTAYEPYLQRVESLSIDDIRGIVNEAPLNGWGVSQHEAEALVSWLDRRKGLVRPALEIYLR